MTTTLATALVIALATALALLRLALRWRGLRAAGADRPMLPWTSLIALQAALALLLWCALFPPPGPSATGVLVLATAATPLSAIGGLPPGARVLALPEAPAMPGVARVPDLATALRARRPDRLQVLGTGLVARDREAAAGIALQFHALPLPRGLTGLWREDVAIVGLPFQVAGDAAGLAQGHVDLLDPAGRVVATAAIASDGRFALSATAPIAGPLVFALRLRDARGDAVQRTELPMQVHAGATPRLLLLAGGPGPELKYLRRWAADAGLPQDARIALGGGATIRDGVPRLDAASLRASDVVVLDDRAWRALDGAGRAALLQAVDGGLGMLVRLTGAVDGTDRARWRALGFDIRSADLPEGVQLPRAITRAEASAPNAQATVAPAIADAASDAPSPTRQPLRVRGEDLQPLLVDAAGEPLAAWRARGRGRLGLAWFGDSYRLVLGGDAPAHARLWSGVLGTLARARAAPAPWIDPEPARVGQRMLVCAASADLQLRDALGAPVALHVEPRDAAYCAAAWPRRAGWYQARAGAGIADVLVLDDDALPGLRARADRDATLALASTPTPTTTHGRLPATAAIDPPPGPRWPWFLGWLLACAASWTLERRLLRAAPVARG
jgi:hypothetical protein